MGNPASTYSSLTSILLGLLLLHSLSAAAQNATGPASLKQGQSTEASSSDLGAQVRELREAVAALTAQVAQMQQELAANRAPQPAVSLSAALEPAVPPSPPSPPVPKTLAASTSASTSTAPAESVAPPVVVTAEDRTVLDGLHGTTISAAFDGYYAYNFNVPAGQRNQLRAYDLSSNSFGINQANIILEHAPDVASGNRLGGRIDLQFGQATETLQGSSANELHPEVWRNVLQAYGTYVAPIGSGLQLDFGKFTSSLGIEGNYTKDQINYSRSFFFDFLPFYHNGLRANYNVTPRLNVAYWLVNAAQQTEDFNGFKSQAFLFTTKPAKNLNWTLNYYFGQEAHDTAPDGTSIKPTPDGREHIFDTYATWTPTAKLTLVGEADLVINRTYHQSAPQHVAGGAAYVRYQLPARYAIAARGEYLADPNGFFSGTSQALKELTFTFEHTLPQNFVLRTEYRRDFSNQAYFLTGTQGLLRHAQSTATVGMTWWWGGKQGSW